jgi:hypothetical protein
MRKSNLVLKVMLFGLLVNSAIICQTYYHSEAGLPYSTKLTKTSFEMVLDESNSNPFDFGLVVAKDNDSFPYIIFAPIKSLTGSEYLRFLNYERSVHMPINKIKELIAGLNEAKKYWGLPFSNTQGISIEFMYAPEQKIIPQSENVVKWKPSLAFYFLNNTIGPKATLIIGELPEGKEYLLDAKTVILLADTLNSIVEKNSH